MRLRSTARQYREIFVPVESPIIEIRARVAARVAALPERRARFAEALDAAATGMTSELCGGSAIVAALRALGLDPFVPASFAFLATRVLEIELATSVGDTAWEGALAPRPITSITGATIFARAPNTSFVDPANPLAFGERVKTTLFGRVTGVAVTNANKAVGLRVTSILGGNPAQVGGMIVAVPASSSDVVSVVWDGIFPFHLSSDTTDMEVVSSATTELVSELICIGSASAPMPAGDSDAPLSAGDSDAPLSAVVWRSPFVVRFGATQRGSYVDEDRHEVLPEDSVRWRCGAPVQPAAPPRPVDSWFVVPDGPGPSRRGIFSLASVPIVLTRKGFASFAAAFPPLDVNEASEYEAVQAAFAASRRHKDEANQGTRDLIRDFVSAMQCDVRTAAFYVSSAPMGDRAATLQAAINEYLDASSRAPPPSYMLDARFIDLNEEEEVGGDEAGGGGGTNASNVTITAARFRVIARACFELQLDSEIWTETDAKDLESALNRAADGLSSAFPHQQHLDAHFHHLRDHGPQQGIGQRARGYDGAEAPIALRWFASLLESIDVSDATISPESAAAIRGDDFGAPFGGLGAVTAAGAVDYRAELIKIWTVHAPEKLENVDKVLLKYKGKEAEMITKLEKKYKKITKWVCSRRGAVFVDDPCARDAPLCNATEDHLVAIDLERQPGRRGAGHRRPGRRGARHRRPAPVAGRWPRVIRADRDPLALPGGSRW